MKNRPNKTTTLVALAAGPLLVMVLACGVGTKSPNSNSQSQKESEEDWMTIDDSKEALQELRSRAQKRDQERLEELLSGKVRFLESYHERILKAHGDSISARIAARLKTSPDAERYGLISFGLTLRLEEIRPVLVEALRSSDPEVRENALFALKMGKPWKDEKAAEFLRFVVGEPEIETSVADCLDHSAAQVGGISSRNLWDALTAFGDRPISRPVGISNGFETRPAALLDESNGRFS